MKTVGLIFLLPLMALGQQAIQRFEYDIPDFSGGINVGVDPTKLAPNEALELTNFSLDKYGSLHKRFGVSNWTDTMISLTGEKMLDIHYLDTRDSGKFIIFAGEDYTYYEKGWTDTVDDWSTHRIGYFADSICHIEYEGANNTFVYAHNTEWISCVSPGDVIEMLDSSFTIIKVISDTSLSIYRGVNVDTTDKWPYGIYKASHGEITLSGFEGRTYVADAGAQPWVFDGVRPWNLAVVDTGTVDSLITIIDTLRAVHYSPYTYGTVSGNQMQADSVSYFDLLFSNGDTICEAGTWVQVNFNVYGSYRDEAGNSHSFSYPYYFRAKVSSVNATHNVLTLDRYFNKWHCNRLPGSVPFQECWNIQNHPLRLDGLTAVELDHCSNFEEEVKARVTWVEFQHPNSGMPYIQKQIIYDSGKDFDVGDYASFYIVSANLVSRAARILDSYDEFIAFDSMVTFVAGDRYYVLWQMPSPYFAIRPDYTGFDSAYYNQIMFSQILFKDKQLIAIGKEYWEASTPLRYWMQEFNGDTLNRDRVWYSDVGRPNIIKDGMNFNLSGANSTNNQSFTLTNASRAIFEIGEFYYIITGEGIYRVITGGAGGGPSGVIYLVKSFGVAGPHAVQTYTDNSAYIMNNDGIWRFDGNQVQNMAYFAGAPSQRISYKIKALTERYRDSDKVVGYFKDEIYFSYPDSDVTLVLFTPTGGISTWDFGIDAINMQVVASDSNYFLFSRPMDSTFVQRYPSADTQICDNWNGMACVAYPVSYRTGWVTLGDDDYNQVLEKLFLTMDKGAGTLNINIYVDFADTAIDSFVVDTTSVRKYRLVPDQRITFDYLSVGITGIPAADIIISRMKIRSYNGEMGRIEP